MEQGRVGAPLEHPELRGSNEPDRDLVPVHRLPVDPPQGHRADVLGHVHDVEDELPANALAKIDRQVETLIISLGSLTHRS